MLFLNDASEETMIFMMIGLVEEALLILRSGSHSGLLC